jgi:hypothetical protein
VYRETGRKETRGGRKEKRGGEKRGKGERWSEVGEMRKGVGERRRGAGEWVSVPPVHPLCYGTAFLRLTPSFQHRSSKSCIQHLPTVKVGWTGTGTLLPSLALFSLPSRPSSPFPRSPYTLSTLSVKPL